jgi:uncharacterized protein YecT (DUF1311 family)
MIVLAVLLLVAGQGDTRERCDRQGGSDMELFQCFAGGRAAEDARLNRAYKAAMARLKTPARKLALREAQRAWIKDRDAECSPFYDETQYGRQGPLEGEACIESRSRARADELEQMARRSR